MFVLDAKYSLMDTPISYLGRKRIMRTLKSMVLAGLMVVVAAPAFASNDFGGSQMNDTAPAEKAEKKKIKHNKKGAKPGAPSKEEPVEGEHHEPAPAEKPQEENKAPTPTP